MPEIAQEFRRGRRVATARRRYSDRRQPEISVPFACDDGDPTDDDLAGVA